MEQAEMLKISEKVMPYLGKFLRYRFRQIDPSLIDDGKQEGVLAVMVEGAAINAEIDAGGDAPLIILKHMRNAASRFIYRFWYHKTLISLDAPIGDDNEFSLKELATYGSTSDPDRVLDAKRAVKAMGALSGVELAILLGFMDNLSVTEIASENRVSESECIAIKSAAAKKVQNSMSTLLGERLALASVKSPSSPISQEVLSRAAGKHGGCA